MEFGPEAPQSLPLPDELLVIRNPVSANAQRAQHQIAELQGQFPFSSVDVYPTLYDGNLSHEENRQANQQRVLNLLQQRVQIGGTEHTKHPLWLVAATGDGTIRDLAEVLLNADNVIGAVPILPLAGGNGNDVSSMVHGFWGKRRPTQQLKHAHIEPVQPLECFIQYGNGVAEVKKGLGYVSMGNLVAKTAKDIDQDRGRYRIVQLVNEKLLAFRALSKASLTTIVEDGDVRDTGEIIVSNGPRMAKYFHWQQELADPQCMLTEVRKNTMSHIAAAGMKLMAARHPSTPIPDGEQVHLRTATDTWIQLDGEAFPLPAQSSVTIQRSQNSVNIVHLRNPERRQTKAFAF